MDTRKRALSVARRCSIGLIAAQLAGCAAPYSLPPNVTTRAGAAAPLTCAAGEAQACRDRGSELECSCAVVAF